jgi:hypothetical protein
LTLQGPQVRDYPGVKHGAEWYYGHLLELLGPVSRNHIRLDVRQTCPQKKNLKDFKNMAIKRYDDQRKGSLAWVIFLSFAATIQLGEMIMKKHAMHALIPIRRE